jgi:hypothetical protein
VQQRRFFVNEIVRVRYLKFALRAFAVVFVLGVYPLTVIWPSGWSWHPGPSEYLQMIVGIYATLGVFLWLASEDPQRNLSLISFAIWSSVVHGGIMAMQSVANTQHVGHLYGDVLALFAVAAVLGWLSPQALTLKFAKNVA